MRETLRRLDIRIADLEIENERLIREREAARKIQAAEKKILLAEVEAHADTKRQLTEERTRLERLEGRALDDFAGKTPSGGQTRDAARGKGGAG